MSEEIDILNIEEKEESDNIMYICQICSFIRLDIDAGTWKLDQETGCMRPLCLKCNEFMIEYEFG